MDPEHVARWSAERGPEKPPELPSPPAKRPRPYEGPRIQGGMTSWAASARNAVTQLPGPAEGRAKLADGDLTALWKGPSDALNALEEAVWRRATPDQARTWFGPRAWEAVLSVQSWEAWLDGVGMTPATEAFLAYERGVKAGGGTLEMPDGLPADPVAMFRYVVGALPGIVDRVDSRSLCALNLTPDELAEAIRSARDACLMNRLQRGERAGAYILATARRLASEREGG